ncbi:glycosyltransferase involved in cell wall biosynthesis [Methanolinea mesophila]|uniref:glycosyltransferase n=1 Tax=Methanolinea mesophila TaxID=547055 RepID=UPI001AE5D061|nr:glycosyltransferase [Methanolinea mesophila]MBP1928344.1 glycosyltransferase involved in cell wall biosynthesis [Methanolinea mesophila]
MKILLSIGLADRSMQHHIAPLANVDKISEILVVRGSEGPNIPKVKYFCPPVFFRDNSFFKTVFKYILLYKVALTEKPNYIHGFMFFPDGLMCLTIGKLLHIKTGVSLIAGPVEIYKPGRSPINKYSYTKTLPKITGITRFYKWLLEKFDFITCTGTFTSDFLINHQIRNDKIYIVPHIVDSRFQKQIASEKIFDIIYIGRLAPVKHLEKTIDIINMIKKEIPEISTAIIGTGPQEEELKQISKQMNLENTIHFLGYKEDVWNWYNLAKISILNSEREGFPYSVIESLSCGVPVITSNCGDVSDVIVNKYNGIIINDNEDIKSFSKAFIDLLKDDELLEEISDNALKSSKDYSDLSATNVWKDLLYQKVLQKR